MTSDQIRAAVIDYIKRTGLGIPDISKRIGYRAPQGLYFFMEGKTRKITGERKVRLLELLRRSNGGPAFLWPSGFLAEGSFGPFKFSVTVEPLDPPDGD